MISSCVPEQFVKLMIRACAYLYIRALSRVIRANKRQRKWLADATRERLWTNEYIYIFISTSPIHQPCPRASGKARQAARYLPTPSRRIFFLPRCGRAFVYTPICFSGGESRGRILTGIAYKRRTNTWHAVVARRRDVRKKRRKRERKREGACLICAQFAARLGSGFSGKEPLSHMYTLRFYGPWRRFFAVRREDIWR